MFDPTAAFSARLQIDLLDRQARDAHRAGQYATAERLLVEAARLADAHSDLPTRIKIHYYLAYSRRMQSGDEDALSAYAWLLSLIDDPAASAELAGNDAALWNLAGAFNNFVEVGRFLPAMPTAQLHAVVERGLAFLADVGRPHWAHGLRLQRGALLKAEGRREAARAEMETALALRRRDPDGPGYTLGAHLCDLGDLLCDLKDDEAAARAYREVWEGGGFSIYERRWAATGLARVEQAQEQWGAAETWAREAVALAAQMQSASAQFLSRDVLLSILLARGTLEEISREAAAFWDWGRKRGGVETSYTTTLRLAQVRLAQARAALGLDPNPNAELPETIGSTEFSHHVRRYVIAAEQWFSRAWYPAQRLDLQASVQFKRDNLSQLGHKIYALQDLVIEEKKRILTLLNSALEADKENYELRDNLLLQAEKLAQDLSNINSLIMIRYWHAATLKEQGHFQRAWLILNWLVDLIFSRQNLYFVLGNEETIHCCAMAIAEFVAISHILSNVPSSKLYAILNQGLLLFNEIGRSDVTHNLRLQRGILMFRAMEWDDACEELETALSLRRRSSARGYTLGMHLNSLGQLLALLGDVENSRRCFFEVLDSEYSASSEECSAAFMGLAGLSLLLEDTKEFARWTKEMTSLANQMQDSFMQSVIKMYTIFHLLQEEKVSDAISEGAKLWFTNRHKSIPMLSYLNAVILTFVRVAMVQSALGLGSNLDIQLPDKLSETLTEETRKSAKRYLASAEKWLERAQVFAQSADAPTNVNLFEHFLEELPDILNDFRDLLDDYIA